MSCARRPRRNQSGETLIEVLAAVMVLGIAALAILAGMELSIKTSDVHRKQTTGSAYARSYAEAIQRHIAADAANYMPCAGANVYTPDIVGFGSQMPAGYSATQDAAKRVPPNG